MITSWINTLGLRRLLIIALGSLFHKILVQLNYYSIHLPIKNEILELQKSGLKATAYRNLIQVRKPGKNKKYLIRPGTSDKAVLFQVIIYKEYLPLIELIAANNLSETITTIVDAGSNIGLTSLFFKSYYPHSTIIAIEPDPENQMQHTKNIEINKFSESITLVRKALWVNSDERLAIAFDFRGGQHWSRRVNISDEDENANFIESISLSDVIKTYCSKTIVDILKIDIEGSEHLLFQDDTFIRNLKEKVRFLTLEIHDEFESRSSIIQILENNCFKVSSIGETTFCANENLLKFE